MVKALNRYREQMVGEAVMGTNTADHWSRVNQDQRRIDFETDFGPDVKWRSNEPQEGETEGWLALLPACPGSNACYVGPLVWVQLRGSSSTAFAPTDTSFRHGKRRVQRSPVQPFPYRLLHNPAGNFREVSAFGPCHGPIMPRLGGWSLGLDSN